MTLVSSERSRWALRMLIEAGFAVGCTSCFYRLLVSCIGLPPSR